MTMHYAWQGIQPYCGSRANTPLLTEDPLLVTCGRCLRTDYVREATRSKRLADRAAVQQVIDVLAEAVNDAADEAGWCSTYEDIVDETIEPALAPLGLTWNKRPSTNWDVETIHSTLYGVSDDEDEVYEHIANNIRAYVTLTQH
jgi:hypothetical protein